MIFALIVHKYHIVAYSVNKTVYHYSTDCSPLTLRSTTWGKLDNKCVFCGSLKTLTFQTCTLLGLILQGRVQLNFNVFWRKKNKNICYLVNIDISNLLNSLLAMLLMSYVKMMVIKSSV